MPSEKIELPEPTVWVEVDEYQSGQPYWKAAHLSAEAIKGEHRRVPCVSLAKAEEFAILAVQKERERLLTRFDDVMAGSGIGRDDRHYIIDRVRNTR